MFREIRNNLIVFYTTEYFSRNIARLLFHGFFCKTVKKLILIILFFFDDTEVNFFHHNNESSNALFQEFFLLFKQAELSLI